MSSSILRMWDIFKHLEDGELDDIAYIYIYGGERSSQHGLSAVYISKSDKNVYFTGLNCLVGQHWANPAIGSSLDHVRPTVSLTNKTKVKNLCDLGLAKIVVSSEFGAGLTEKHELYMWGEESEAWLYNGDNTVMFARFVTRENCRFCRYHYIDSTATKANGTLLMIHCNGQFYETRCRRSLVFRTPPRGPYKRFLKFHGNVATCECGEKCTSKELGGEDLAFCEPCNWYQEVELVSDIGPRKINLKDDVIDMDCGDAFMALLTASNKVVIWGRIASSRYNGYLDIPESVTIKSVCCGHSHLAAISSCGQLFTCGLGDTGRLGYPWDEGMGHTTLRMVPIQGTVEKVCCGKTATVCLTLDGLLICFGGNMTMSPSGFISMVDSGFITTPTVLSEKHRFCDLQNARMMDVFAAKTKNSAVISWGGNSSVRSPKFDLEANYCLEALANLPATYPSTGEIERNEDIPVSVKLTDQNTQTSSPDSEIP